MTASHKRNLPIFVTSRSQKRLHDSGNDLLSLFVCLFLFFPSVQRSFSDSITMKLISWENIAWGWRQHRQLGTFANCIFQF